MPFKVVVIATLLLLKLVIVAVVLLPIGVTTIYGDDFSCIKPIENIPLLDETEVIPPECFTRLPLVSNDANMNKGDIIYSTFVTAF